MIRWYTLGVSQVLHPSLLDSIKARPIAGGGQGGSISSPQNFLEVKKSDFTKDITTVTVVNSRFSNFIVILLSRQIARQILLLSKF